MTCLRVWPGSAAASPSCFRRCVEGPGHLTHQRELRDEVVRRLGTVRLVLGVEVVAEALAPGVEHHRRVGGRVLPQRLEEHGGEAVDRVGRHPLGRREVRDGVVGAEDEPGPVDERERRHGAAPNIPGRPDRRDRDLEQATPADRRRYGGLMLCTSTPPAK